MFVVVDGVCETCVNDDMIRVDEFDDDDDDVTNGLDG